MTDFLFLIPAVLALCFAFFAIIAGRSAAPYVPMRRKHIDTMVSLANPQAGEQWLDLGSGDGRIVFAAGKCGADVTGVELHPFLHHYADAKRRIVAREQSIRFKRGDLWHADVSQADVLSIFFIKDKMPQLKEKLQREMKPGSRVVSHIFQFPDWQYEKKDGSIYLYIVE